MSSAVSIKDVAALAGVSIGTVSNVLNRPDVVADETRRKVLAAIEELGFVRNESARQLRTGTARAIGLVVPDVSNPFFTDVARGAEDAASDAGHMVILCNSDESEQRQDRHLQLLAEQRVHGVLITPVDAAPEPVRRLRDRGVSVVLLDRHADVADACSVSVDHRIGGTLAINHLLAEGHRELAMVTGPLSIAQCRQRLDGARDALVAAGRDPDGLRVVEVAAMNVASGRNAGERVLAGTRRPDALFCANDLLALGVLQVMVRAGVRVPGELAIVGYDDIDFAAAAAVPLTSVRQPSRSLGRRAAELVLGETNSPREHVHHHVVFPPELVVRESSRRFR
ncbi:LacI family DNA-binding transcriptional regulator [Kutzneria buriramensis]|uniref:LacI family transcriptional regulator n=1 Tax=Kutzneria buriramensis TaxID=1045776 RepID=A0A3E0I601_9PSEU|nr:LacI family DNA-binding transcriptional regulator [Kutzneria buriramensis]REH54162.1 LacI family transcriptional regulator [Kutzneria buriramensis]